MRRTLEDVLSDEPRLAEAETLPEAEEGLRAIFLAAQGDANAYAAERLQEVFQVAERALALSEAFPVEGLVSSRARPHEGPWYRRLQRAVARYGAGLLLAACAPLVADVSVTLAIAAAVTALLTLTATRRSSDPVGLRPADSKAVSAKIRGLLSAADRSVLSMTAPVTEGPSARKPSHFLDEDILQMMQDALALGREAEPGSDAAAIAANAERLVQRAGYRVVWEDDTDAFEVMHDPSFSGSLLLKPALVHQTQPGRIVFGVKVKGQTV